jgi:hypothetical protein
VTPPAVPVAVVSAVVSVVPVASTGGEVYVSLYCPFYLSHSRVPTAPVSVVVVAGAVSVVVPVAVVELWKSKL